MYSNRSADRRASSNKGGCMKAQSTHNRTDIRMQRRRRIRTAVQRRRTASVPTCATLPSTWSGPPIDLPVMEFLIQSGYDDPILYGTNPYMDSIPAWYSQEITQRCWPERPMRQVEVQPYVAPPRSLPWGAISAAGMSCWAFVQLMSSVNFGTVCLFLFGLLFAEQKLPLPPHYRKVMQGGTFLAIIALVIGLTLS